MLAEAVSTFAQTTQTLSAADLDRPWAWRDYTEEGIRFAFFVTYQELRELAVTMWQARQEHGQPPTSAQLILAQYHAAYRDLHAALLGLEAEPANQPPAEAEWPVRRVLAHILGADLGFYAVVRYTLDRHRLNDGRPAQVSEEALLPLLGLDEAAYGALMREPVEKLLAYYDTHHTRLLGELAGLAEAELELPSTYWENEAMPLRFRLHRFDAHLRQHTVQIDKIRLAISQPPTEAQRLLRLIYAALAEVEGAQLGVPDLGQAQWQALARTIASRAEDLAARLT